MLLRLEEVSRSVGTRLLFRDVDLTLNRGDRVGLVGPNGVGKTTLLRIAAGIDPPDSGRRVVPRDVRIAMLSQEIDPGRTVSVREEVSSALSHLTDLEDEMRKLEAEMEGLGRQGRDVPADVAEHYDRARVAFEFGGGFEREARVERVLAGLGFHGDNPGRPLNTFSGGWLMRVELAKLLLSAPDVLLLDEPTNHLDLPSIEWFEETLCEFGGAVIMISHDRAFLRRHVDRVAELEAARFTLYTGNYDRYLELKVERSEQLESQKRNQDRQIAEQERFIERFRSKASKARQVQSRIKALKKLQRIELPPRSGARIRLKLPPPDRAGESIVRLKDVHKSYGEKQVYEGIDFFVRRGDRIALAGPNGAGKSTLLRIAAGNLDFDAGTREFGHNVKVAFYAQHQLDGLNASNTVLEELATAATTNDVPRLRGHLGAFLFSGDDVKKQVQVLSGGEKARLALAKLLLRPVNFLVLDEPTNHLDVMACEVLEDALRGYPGALLFISHDREFINALATRVVEVVDGRLTEYLGNYDDYRRRVDSSQPTGMSLPEAVPAVPTTKQERVAARAQARDQTRRLERVRKRLSNLELEIAATEEELEQLGWRLGDPEVYRDGERVRALEAERDTLRGRVEASYRDWEAAAAEQAELEADA